MSKVSYDFIVDNLIAIDAPIGTDPDTLIEQVKQKLIERIQEGDITFMFQNIFDSETGDYCDDWQNYHGRDIATVDFDSAYIVTAEVECGCDCSGPELRNRVDAQ
jgi:hypothetical protein